MAAPLSTGSHSSTLSHWPCHSRCLLHYSCRLGNTQVSFSRRSHPPGPCPLSTGRAPETLLRPWPAPCPAHTNTTLSPGHPVCPSSQQSSSSSSCSPALHPVPGWSTGEDEHGPSPCAVGSLPASHSPSSSQGDVHELREDQEPAWGASRASHGLSWECHKDKGKTGSTRLPSAPPQQYLGDIGQLQGSDSTCSNGQVLQHTQRAVGGK